MTQRVSRPQRNAKLREIVDRIRIEDFGGNQEKTAEALGVKGATIHYFLKGDRGAGVKLMDGICLYTRKTIEELLGAPSALRAFCELLGWPEAEQEARRKYQHVPAEAFEAVGGWRGAKPPPVINDMIVGNLAETYWRASIAQPTPVPEVAEKHAPKTRKKSGEQLRKIP